MTYIPDCRVDESYNEDFLNETDSQYVLGYDHCVSTGIESFFYNIDNYIPEIQTALGLEEDDEIEIDHNILNGDKEFEDYTEDELDEIDHLTSLLLLIKNLLGRWAEDSRDELIVSMIEDMKDKEYEELKLKSLNGEWKNALVRHREYMIRYEAGEVPTCWTYKLDENGKPIKIGHCPNGTVIIEPYEEKE